MITLPVSLYFIICESSKWQGTFGKRKMGIYVVNHFGQRIGFARSTLRTTIKFLPWEVAHFGIWRLMLPNNFPEIVVFVMLNAVNLAILFYLLIPLTNTSRKNVYDFAAGTRVVNRITLMYKRVASEDVTLFLFLLVQVNCTKLIVDTY